MVKKTPQIGKENLYITENRLNKNEIWCEADNHSYYVSHMCKRILEF